MQKNISPRQLLPGLWQFQDACNVYVLKCGDAALAVDFGSGAWLKILPRLGIKRLTDVFLTHHHADQCAGLETMRRRPFAVHAPRGDEVFLDPAKIREHARTLAAMPYEPFPDSYGRLAHGIPGVLYDVRANSEIYMHGLCLRVVSTPGHGLNACSYIVEFAGRQLGFCGDAVHAGGTVWQPFNLEWEHWTGKGTLAAWEGVRRLAGIGLDGLCPAHGPAIQENVAGLLRRLDRRLLDFYRAKGSICAGEKDHFIIPVETAAGGCRILPHLYVGPANAYLLVSAAGEALLVDPTTADVKSFESLLQGPLRGVRPAAALVSHAHHDHYEGIPYLQKRYGLKAWLHPRVAEAIRRHPRGLYRGKKTLRIDRVWPETGAWRWHEYTFQVAPWPGQTWWHCVFMAEVDGQKVMFGGDSFQPASRWNGTGGFCAANFSRFRDGYIPSAELALRWRPDILACGHRTVYRFTASRFRRIIRWARFAEQATRALCPSGKLAQDYYFESAARPAAKACRLTAR
ncbi:MAG: MBL fold metallo-hydrolase [Kiritimatiellia bacterium]|jgi:glyoxylase-like metal-dependent hydrolase (beta-lactamase superfamily II)